MRNKTILLGVAMMFMAGSGMVIAKDIKDNSNPVFQQKAKEVVVEGTNNSRTIKATGSEIIRIEGANNKVIIVGSFSKLIIEGTGNIVNAVDVPLVSIQGANNRINAGRIETVKIEGTGNHVHYKSSKNKSGEVAASTEGANNMVMKVK